MTHYQNLKTYNVYCDSLENHFRYTLNNNYKKTNYLTYANLKLQLEPKWMKLINIISYYNSIVVLLMSYHSYSQKKIHNSLLYYRGKRFSVQLVFLVVDIIYNPLVDSKFFFKLV